MCHPGGCLEDKSIRGKLLSVGLQLKIGAPQTERLANGVQSKGLPDDGRRVAEIVELVRRFG